MSLDNQRFDSSTEDRPLRPSRRRDYFVMPSWGWPVIGLAMLLLGVLLGWVLFGTGDEPVVEVPTSPTVIVEVVTATPRPVTATPRSTMTSVPTRLPSETPTDLPTPTSTDTPAPTATPTPELEIAVGTRVKVGDTGGANLRLRSGPGTDFVTFKIVQEGVELEVIGGPERADDFIWWRLRDSVGVVGWAAEDWLIPMQ